MQPFEWSREDIERHSLDMRQFIDFRQSTLTNGMRIVEAYNGSGLSFTILPDRGLDIWTAHYNGVPLTWISQGSPFPPDMAQGWKRQFNGGLLTTCGLTHVGPPETDDVSGEWRDIHGLYTFMRAGDVSVRKGELVGTISEGTIFGEQLRLERHYELKLGKPDIYIADTITNIGDMPAPLMVLYHCNFGFPLVRQGTRLTTAHSAVYARDARAKEGLERWPEYDAATPQYAEQVYFHHVKASGGDMATAMIGHDDFAVALDWTADSLPYLTQWKNTREGIYVCGVEPSNCLPMGRNHARQTGRLVMLEPGESRQVLLTLRVLDGADKVAEQRENIEELQRTGTVVRDAKFDEFM